MSSLQNRSILVIDSGVGGLSICQAIIELERSLQLIYFADNANFPYGMLAEDRLSKRLHEIMVMMLAQHKPDLVVLACNTVSTLVLPELRAAFDVPFVGVVPAIKPAALHSKTKRIGLLATPATIIRDYTDQLIADHAQDCIVIRKGDCDLVIEAENLLLGKDVSDEVLAKTLDVFRDDDGIASVDTIVLGCTHFPLLKSHLDKILPSIEWVDSGRAIAKRVQNLLKERLLKERLLTMGQTVCIENDAKEMLESKTHQIYFSGAKPDSEVFVQSLKAMSLYPHQLHGFSAKIA